jgi:hypothetical protein
MTDAPSVIFSVLSLDLGDRFIVAGTKARWGRVGLAIPGQNLGI